MGALLYSGLILTLTQLTFKVDKISSCHKVKAADCAKYLLPSF